MNNPETIKENEYKDFEVEVSYLIRKRCNVNTDDYAMELDDFEREAFINTELTDWKTAYEESHYTINELLDELRRYVEKDMCRVSEYSGEGRALKRIYRDLQNWEVIEEDYVNV